MKPTTLYVSDLINIRNYVVQAINNYSLAKLTAKELNKMLLVLDKKIVDEILSDDFKEIVGFDTAEQTMKEAAFNNNIKSGLPTNMQQKNVPVVSVAAGKAQHIKPEPV